MNPYFFWPFMSSTWMNFFDYLSQLMLNVRFSETCKLSLLIYKAFLIGKPSTKARRKMDSYCKLKKEGRWTQLWKKKQFVRCRLGDLRHQCVCRQAGRQQDVHFRQSSL